MDYYKKYLKYKTKFLNLKNLKNLQYGGAVGVMPSVPGVVSGEMSPIKSIEDKYKF